MRHKAVSDREFDTIRFPGTSTLLPRSVVPAAPARAVFVDKDGALVDDLPHNVDPAKLRFTPHAVEGLALLARAGYRVIVVSHQPGLAQGVYDRAALKRLQTGLATRLQAGGVHLDDAFACGHASTVSPAGEPSGAGCLCRKPAPGLLRQAAGKHRIDLAESWMIGARLDDVEAGQRAGCRTVLMDVGLETAWRMSPMRTPHARASDLLDAAQLILALDADRAEQQHAEQPAPSLPAPAPSWHHRLRGAASRWVSTALRPASLGNAPQPRP